jgi:hypothetical protein
MLVCLAWLRSSPQRFSRAVQSAIIAHGRVSAPALGSGRSHAIPGAAFRGSAQWGAFHERFDGRANRLGSPREKRPTSAAVRPHAVSWTYCNTAIGMQTPGPLMPQVAPPACLLSSAARPVPGRQPVTSCLAGPCQTSFGGCSSQKQKKPRANCILKSTHAPQPTLEYVESHDPLLSPSIRALLSHEDILVNAVSPPFARASNLTAVISARPPVVASVASQSEPGSGKLRRPIPTRNFLIAAQAQFRGPFCSTTPTFLQLLPAHSPSWLLSISFPLLHDHPLLSVEPHTLIGVSSFLP